MAGSSQLWNYLLLEVESVFPLNLRRPFPFFLPFVVAKRNFHFAYSSRRLIIFADLS